MLANDQCFCDLTSAIQHSWAQDECLNEILPADEWYRDTIYEQPNRTRGFVRGFNADGIGCNCVTDRILVPVRIEIQYCGNLRSEANKLAKGIYDILNGTHEAYTECGKICDITTQLPYPQKFNYGYRIASQVSMRLLRNKR